MKIEKKIIRSGISSLNIPPAVEPTAKKQKTTFTYPMLLHKINLKDLIVCVLLSTVFTLLTFRVYNLPFAVGDDHRIIAMNHPDQMEPAYIQSLYNNDPGLIGTIKNDAQIGRFRPIGWSFTKIQSILFGDYSSAYRIFNVAILLLSLLSLVSICRRLNVSAAPCWIVLAVYTFGRNNETWWTLIPPAQNIGELFLLAGFLYWLKFRQENKNGLKLTSLTFLFAAALVKESFIFCIPFVWLADFFFFSQQKKLFIKEYFQLWFIFSLPLLGLVTVIFLSKTVYSYAYPDSLFSILAYNAYQFLFSSVFLLAPLFMFFLRDHIITRRNLVKFSVLTSSWLIIQLILLKGIKMDDQHHYLAPGLLLVLILSSLALHYLRLRSKIIYIGVFSIYLLFTVWQAKNTFVNSRYYAARVESYYKMIAGIKESNPRKIYYVANTRIAGDWLMGTSAIIREKRITAPLIFCPTKQDANEWEVKFLQTRPPIAFPLIDFKNIKLGKGDWLINVECIKEIKTERTTETNYDCGIPDLQGLQRNFLKIPNTKAIYYDVRLFNFPGELIEKKTIEYDAFQINN